MQYDENAEKYGYEGEMTLLKCDKLTAYKGDVTIPVYGTIADAEVYLKKDVDEAIAELKEFAEDACLERDDNQTAIDELKAFRIIQGDTGGYGAPSYKCDTDGNRIEEWSDVCEVYDRSEADKVIAEKDTEIAELKADINNVLIQNRELCQALQAMYSAEEYTKLQDDVVDAGMENRRLKRALWLARANRAKEHVWHDVKTDGSPRDDYKGHDWVLVQYQENGGFLLIPRIAEYRKNLKRWVLIDENYITPHHNYLLKDCRVIGWRDIDFAYYGRKFFVQQEINKNVERKCRAKAEEYK